MRLGSGHGLVSYGILYRLTVGVYFEKVCSVLYPHRHPRWTKNNVARVRLERLLSKELSVQDNYFHRLTRHTHQI